MRLAFTIQFLIFSLQVYCQEIGKNYLNNETFTYNDLIDSYKKFDQQSEKLKLLEYSKSDGSFPIHLAVFNNLQKFDAPQQNGENELVILIMNGIHPGESDGIDASFLFTQKLINGEIKIPNQVTICIIPVYNIEGMINRKEFTRTNQNGPIEKGFRGNGLNLDLNRDFIKSDSKNTIAFYEIFNDWNPDVFIDNHTSNGADYQYTMTLIATQKQKLGGKTADFLYQKMLPEIYSQMKSRNWELAPYVNVFGNPPDEKGFDEFLETPRYSTGYAALFSTIGFVPETHMLKPYKNRVESTLAIMEVILEFSKNHIQEIKKSRMIDTQAASLSKEYKTNFKLNKNVFDSITFKGYEAEKLPSKIGNYKRLFYNRNKPFTKKIRYYNFYEPSLTINLPKAYIIPKTQWKTIEKLKYNKVEMIDLMSDTIINVNAIYIDQYECSSKAYESHHYNRNVKSILKPTKIQFLKGDKVIFMNQSKNRFIAEVLEPMANDSYFSWNYFDGFLDQKEGFSDYVFEDDAFQLLQEDKNLNSKFETWKEQNPDKLNNQYEVLEFIFKNSKHYENEYNRMPYFRID